VYKIFPVDIFYVEYNPAQTSYDENKSGYDENGNYCVYLHISGDEDLSTSLNHELRHAFEDYNRISKNESRLSDTRESKLFYSGDFEKLITGQIKGEFGMFKSIFYVLYMTSKMEASAFAENIYDNTNTDLIFGNLKYIMNRGYLNGMKNDKKVQRTWLDLKSKVKIPILDKFNDYMMFVKWVDKYIQYRAIKIFKKLQKVKYFPIWMPKIKKSHNK